MPITFSPHEILALLLEIETNDVPTDALQSARRKLEAEYRRQRGQDPPLKIFHMQDDVERHLTEYQASLIDGYFTLDPDGRILGYFKGQPVVQAYTSPMQTRTSSTRPNILVVAREGAPKNLPRLGWADHFIPAQGVSWAEAEVAIEDWIMHYQKKLST